MKREPVRLSRMELLDKLSEIVNASTNDPAEDLIAIGQALQKIGEALRGQSLPDARAIITAVRAVS